MATRRRPRVVDRDGVEGRLRQLDVADPHAPVALVQLSHGVRVAVPFELLAQHDDGGYTIPARWADFANVSDERVSIPVLAEKVKVEVRPARETAVRVRRRVVTTAQEVEVPLWRERVEVERVPIGSFVDRAPEPRQEGDTLIVPCVEEVAVIEKRLRLREELRIRVVREQHVHRETVLVRQHELQIEPTEPTFSIDPDHPKGDEP